MLHNYTLFLSWPFGSMHFCEQLFSSMKHTKSKIASKISEETLENSLRIATTDIEPDIDVLFSQKQGQISNMFYVFVALFYCFLKKIFLKEVLLHISISHIICFKCSPRQFLFTLYGPGKPKVWTSIYYGVILNNKSVWNL